MSAVVEDVERVRRILLKSLAVPKELLFSGSRNQETVPASFTAYRERVKSDEAWLRKRIEGR